MAAGKQEGPLGKQSCSGGAVAPPDERLSPSLLRRRLLSALTDPRVSRFFQLSPADEEEKMPPTVPDRHPLDRRVVRLLHGLRSEATPPVSFNNWANILSGFFNSNTNLLATNRPADEEEMLPLTVPARHPLDGRVFRLVHGVRANILSCFFNSNINFLATLPHLPIILWNRYFPPLPPRQPFNRSIVKYLRPAGVGPLAGSVFLRGAKNVAICSLSLRAGYHYLSRRGMSVVPACGLGRQTAEELLIWQKSLENLKQSLDAERMSLDTIRLSLTESWMNFGKVKNRKPTSRFGLLQNEVHAHFKLYLRRAVVTCTSVVLLGVVLVVSLQPGEAKKLPGNLMLVSQDWWLGLRNQVRKLVMLPQLDDGKPKPLPSSPEPRPSQLVVIMGGAPPLYSGTISELPSTRSSPEEDAER